MFDLFKMTEGSANKKFIMVLGVTTACVVLVHYFHQIKLARLNIEKLQRES